MPAIPQNTSAQKHYLYKKGTYTSKYSYNHVLKIWVFGLTRVRLEIVICVNTIYGYHYRALTQLMYQTFENPLEDEPRVEPLFVEVWSEIVTDIVLGFKTSEEKSKIDLQPAEI